MMKVRIDKARARVTAKYYVEGSVLAQTIRAEGRGIETHLEIESPEPPERVAAVIRNAENGCYTIQTVKHPTPAETTASLNGQPLDWETYVRR
jgi:hypothetical protein